MTADPSRSENTEHDPRQRESLYERPPLAEVICEVRWQLRPLPGAGPFVGEVPQPLLDAHYQAFLEDARAAANALGLPTLERVHPIEFPLEFRPHVPDVRFRRARDTWPLFQIGPGLFTVNVVPPYKGWSNFRIFLDSCLDLLIRQYPISNRYLRVQRIELRYLNAFDNDFGYSSLRSFSKKYLNIHTSLTDSFVEYFIDETRPTDGAEMVSFFRKGRPDDLVVVRLGTGSKNQRPAAILDLSTRRDLASPEFMDAKSLLAWFDAAHDTISELFASLTNDELRRVMGPLVQLSE